MDYFVYAILGTSLLANAYLGFVLYRKRSTLTTDAKKLLSEILSGGAVVRVDVLDTSALMYRSPKG